MSFKILNTIGPGFADEGKKILSEVAEIEYKIPSQEELSKIIGEHDGVFVGLGLNFDEKVLTHASKLKVIATATTGLDHIDTAFAAKRGITVLSLRGEDEFLNTITGTAELAMGLIIDLVRKTPFAFDDVRNYRWKRNNFRGTSLYGKTLGIVGLGRLGKIVAGYGKAFGMNVIFTDPKILEYPDCKKVSFEALLQQSDVVSIHVHLTPDTENLFGAEAFEKMKTGAFLVNTSRGKIVDEEAVVTALTQKKIGGYAADVLADELSFETAGFKNHPLVEYAKKNTNLIVVPHIGGMTEDSRIATDVFMAKKVKEFLVSKPFSALE